MVDKNQYKKARTQFFLAFLLVQWLEVSHVFIDLVLSY